MATVTVSSSTTLALLSYAAGDDIVITGSATLTCDSDPAAKPLPRSISSSSTAATFKIRNSATAFSPGNLWKFAFSQVGTAASNGSLNFTNGATLDIEGEFLPVYTATGAANETVLDASNLLGVDIDFAYAVQVESAPGSDVWTWVTVATIGGAGNGYLCTVNKSDFGTGLTNRVLFYDHTTRLLQTGDGTNGALFAAGTRFRIPNIYLHIDPFTLTAAAGWSTAAGSQPVVASAGAPTASDVNFVCGAEVFTVSGTPSSTTITTANRGADGSTATAHAAGAVLRAIPTFGLAASGSVRMFPSGIIKLKRMFSGRYISWRFFIPASLQMEDCAIVKPTNVGQGIAGVVNSLGLTRVLFHSTLTRGASDAMNITGNNCPLYFDDVKVVVQQSANANTSIIGDNLMMNFFGNTNVEFMRGLKSHRIGGPSTTSLGGTFEGVAFSYNLLKTGEFQDIELIASTLRVQNTAGVEFSKIRYSASNKTLVTAEQAPLFIGSTFIATDCIFRDFNVMPGGVAPYGAWISDAGNNNVFHNLVGGAVSAIDCQNRTRRLAAVYGAGSVYSNITLTNRRAEAIPILIDALCSNCRISNVRTDGYNNSWSAGGLSMATAVGLLVDRAPGALIVGPYPKTQAITLAPYANTGELGALGVTPRYDPDSTVLSGGAYLSLANNRVYIEATGATAIIKATRPVLGVASIPTSGQDVEFFVGPGSLTADFRLCKWGDDIAAVSWATLSRANLYTALNALSGYSSNRGLNLQVRLTAATTQAGRLFTTISIPVLMDAAFLPAVKEVVLSVLGAAPGSVAVLNYGTAEQQSGVVNGSGTVSFSAPYNMDGAPKAYTLELRGLSASSQSISGTYLKAGASVPVPQQALAGYVAGPYAGASFNKSTKVVTVSSAMTTAQLWSAWREYIVQLANFDAADEWSYPTLDTGAGAVAFSGSGSLSGFFTDVNGAVVSATVSNIVAGSRILIVRTDTNAVMANAVVLGTSYSLNIQTATAIPISVDVRKGTAAPFYQPWATTGAIDPVGGFAATANQQPD